MSYYLFLDDVRIVKDVRWQILPDRTDWVIVRNYEQFVTVLNTLGLPKYITFDHDLADEHYNSSTWMEDNPQYKEKTGYDCAKFLVEFCYDHQFHMCEYNCHSLNPIGKKKILDYLGDHEKICYQRDMEEHKPTNTDLL